ncbi:MAG TPA: nucleoside deaminase [Burkholderiales bacterium]|nr:nucleoside deaminase [Burkholderiales bacterium]
MADASDDETWLRRVIALAQQSRDAGNHPFAALVTGSDGNVLAEAFNDFRSDCTGHAEVVAVRMVSSRMKPGELGAATLYSSAEPCAMCAGAIYWSGIGRVVYALSEEKLLELTGNHPGNPTLSLPCREVFARGQRGIEVVGPMLEGEALMPHKGFWR